MYVDIVISNAFNLNTNFFFYFLSFPCHACQGSFLACQGSLPCLSGVIAMLVRGPFLACQGSFPCLSGVLALLVWGPCLACRRHDCIVYCLVNNIR